MTIFKENNQGCLLTLIGGTLFLLLKTIILYFFWEWFIQPLGMSEINLAQSLGLILVLDFLKFKKTKKDDVPTWVFILDVLVNLSILLGLGYLIHYILL
jgi:hypothetical protein